MRPAALIYNPTAGRQRHEQILESVLSALRQGGFDVEPVPTQAPGDASRLARDRAGKMEAVFAFGGDGTVREVAAGLLGTETALGIVPGGTVNVLAMSLGLPRDPLSAAKLAGRLEVQKLDVGLIGEMPFLMMVSAGLDASVMAGLDTRLKWRIGKAAYVWQGLQEWWRYPYPRFEVIADGVPLEASFVAVSNIPYYGGAYALAPGARPHDGKLDLVLFRGNGRSDTLGFALDLLRGVHLRRSDVTVRHVQEVELRSPAGAVAQIDGDVCEERLPFTVRIAPDPLLVLSPEIPPT
ncbi:MAG TPA: diacylglycerol kinase family protein [Thermoanaerobaculia bacterium]|nr:diacylglycerol kinase family protein [Thermoanaerobaculia bacterium]